MSATSRGTIKSLWFAAAARALDMSTAASARLGSARGAMQQKMQAPLLKCRTAAWLAATALPAWLAEGTKVHKDDVKGLLHGSLATPKDRGAAD